VELYISSARRDRRNGRDKLVLLCPEMETQRVLKELFFIDENGAFTGGIAEAFFEDEAARIAYIQGAFLGGGSCSLPSESGKSGYHLEFVFFDKAVAECFCELMDASSLWVKLASRKETQVAYIKSKEMISDFLSIIGAENALKKFFAVMERREEAGRQNREANFLAGNIDKTVTAAAKQVRAIQILKEKGLYDGLDDDLKVLADLREKEPTKTLQQLADMLGVSKSCLNHRIRKLTEIAEQSEQP
jgi:DNA-binding protein WhiA